MVSCAYIIKGVSSPIGGVVKNAGSRLFMQKAEISGCRDPASLGVRPSPRCDLRVLGVRRRIFPLEPERYRRNSTNDTNHPKGMPAEEFITNEEHTTFPGCGRPRRAYSGHDDGKRSGSGPEYPDLPVGRDRVDHHLLGPQRQRQGDPRGRSLPSANTAFPRHHARLKKHYGSRDRPCGGAGCLWWETSRW